MSILSSHSRRKAPPQPDLGLVPDDLRTREGQLWLDQNVPGWQHAIDQGFIAGAADAARLLGETPPPRKTISLGGLEEEFRETPAPPEGGPRGGWQASLAEGLEGMAAEAMQPVVKPAKRFAILQVIQTIAQVVIAFGVIAILVVML